MQRVAMANPYHLILSLYSNWKAEETMFVWAESQSTPVIALLGFAFCYGLTALIFVALKVSSRCHFVLILSPITPSILSPLGTITGLLIAFLAVRVWTNFDNAGVYIAKEAGAVREAVVLADMLPGATGNEVCSAANAYLAFAETEDWPAMAEGRANLRRLPPGLPGAIRSLVAFAPASEGQKIAQQRAIEAISQALEARSNRILLSEASIEPIQWIAILISYGMMLVTLAIVHIDRPWTAAFAMLIVSTAVGAALVLLVDYDRPFGSGGIKLAPVALREIEGGDRLRSPIDLCNASG
jgi:hypothetical protein